MILVTSANTNLPNENLAIFTANIEASLVKLKINYELFLWKDDVAITKFDQSQLLTYEMVINVHSQFCWQSGLKHPKMINFIHGPGIADEFTRYNKNFLRNIWGNNFSPMNKAYFNIFESEELLKQTTCNEFQVNYSRDLVINDISDCGKLFKSLLVKSEAA